MEKVNRTSKADEQTSYIERMKLFLFLPLYNKHLINRAGGLYGRILTSVVCTNLTAFGLYLRPRSKFSHLDLLLG